MVAQLPASSTQPSQYRSPQSHPVVTWDPLPADFVLSDDPVDNLQQPALAAALTDALGANGRIRPEMLIATNMGLVATVSRKLVVKAPDWFYVPRVHPMASGPMASGPMSSGPMSSGPMSSGLIRRSYTPHLEGSWVEVVMEFLSEAEGGELSVRSSPPFGKLYVYEQILQVPTYVTYDPYDHSLEVRQRQADGYRLSEPDPQGRFWIPGLELWLGRWQGERLGLETEWLRWWDPDGNLLMWSSEQAEQERQRADAEYQRAEQEKRKAELLAAKLRELGVDPDDLKLEP